MRSQAICIAIFFALSGAASAQQTPTPAACTRAPHMRAGNPSSQMIAARHAMKQACAADMATYCANVPRGCGAPKRCLMSHEAQLSASCKSAQQNLHATRHGA